MNTANHISPNPTRLSDSSAAPATCTRPTPTGSGVVRDTASVAGEATQSVDAGLSDDRSSTSAGLKIDEREMERLVRRSQRWRYPQWMIIANELKAELPAVPLHTSVAIADVASRPRPRRRGQPWIASVVLHVGVFLLLAFCGMAASDLADSPRLLQLEFQHEFVKPDSIPVRAVPPRQPETLAATLGGSAVVADVRGGGDLASPRMNVGPARVMQPRQGTGLGSGPANGVRGLFAGGGAMLTAANPGGNGAEFFGVLAGGRRFVFVVDCSRSMLQGGRWRAACAELDRSLRELGPEREFYVIFFDKYAHRMFRSNKPESKMLPASPENLDRFRRWAVSVELGFQTKPMLAMKYALRLQPDAVFLLSDGEFQDRTAHFLRRNNVVRRPPNVRLTEIPVHTIGFHNLQAQDGLRRIAKENGGTYRFVGAGESAALARAAN